MIQNFNIKNISAQKEINSDIINTRNSDTEKLNSTLISKLNLRKNNTFDINFNPKTYNCFKKEIHHSNIKSLNKKLFNNIYNINKNNVIEKERNSNFRSLIQIPKYKIISNKINKDSFETINKSKTQENFFSPNNYYLKKHNKYIKKKFPFIPLMENINRKGIILNKTNSFYPNISNKLQNNKIIYFNSSINDFYKKNDDISLDFQFGKINKSKHSLILPKSNSVSFIRNLFNFFDKKVKKKKIIKNIKNNNSDEKIRIEDINKKIFKGFSFLSMNKSVLDTLFKKTPIKIKSGLLTSMSEEKINSDVCLSPFSNSYGYILDDLSEKIGFMRGSINMIYPKISKAKYQIKELERTDEFKKISKITKIKKNKYNSENIENIYEKIDKIYNRIKPKKVIKKFFTKYPINYQKKGEKIYSKMYTMKNQHFFIEKD